MPAAEKEVFATPGWNFVGGDRQIEAILRDLPPNAPLVVRNRLANVLATVAGLNDLGRLDPWEPLPLRVHVPENALAEPALGLADVYPPECFQALLAERLYHLGTAPETEVAGPEALVLAVGYTAAHEPAAARLAGWLGRQGAVSTVLLAPRGQELATPLRPFAGEAWSAGHWGGLNAFSLAHVEEAVQERDPAVIYVAAADPTALLYSGVGAADYWLRRLGGTAKEAGARVRLLAFAAEAVAGTPAPLLELARRHLEVELGASSTQADPRFAATREAIAIDLL
jgi:hypothetical protein